MRTIKKAELTTQQIVGLTILIISFGVLLFFLARLNLQELTDKEICHNSVVLYDKNPNPLKSNALDCRTSYVCISGGGDCGDFSSTIKREIKLTSDENTNKDRIMKQLAEEMADCWWMFGEGKVDYANFEGFGNKICAMCSVIAFDKTIQGKDYSITYEEFYKFLESTPKDEAEFYLSYIYNTPDKNKIGASEDYLSRKLIFTEQYFILTGMGKSWINWGLNKHWLPMGFEDIFGRKLFDQEYVIPLTILEKTPENFEELGCDEFITKA